MSGTYCFENEALAAWYRGLAAQGDITVLSFRELVGEFVPAPPLTDSQRRLVFDALLDEGDRAMAEPIWLTIQALREAQVVTPEDVEFSLSLLPDTPKNQALHRIFLRLLETPLTDDWTAQVQELLDGLKNLAVVSPWPKLCFISANPGTFLFAEVAKAFRYAEGVEETRSFSVVDWPGTARRCRPAVGFAGETRGTLQRLALHARRLADRGVPLDQIVVPLHAEPRAREWLGYAFDRLHLPWRDCGGGEPAPSESARPLALLLEALRRDKTRKLKDRLKLSALLASDRIGRQAGVDWPSYLRKLVGLDKISSADAEYLLGLSPARRPAPAAPTGVRVLPFIPVPAGSPLTVLAFSDATLLTPPRAPHLLKTAEIETLHRAGIPLPRWTEERAARVAMLERFLLPAAGRRFLFSALPAGTLKTAWKRLKPATTVDTPALLAMEPATLAAAPKTLSATQLETYAQCPARYFFSHRLRLRTPGAPERQYPLLLGQITHKALEHFFQDRTDFRALLADAAATETVLLELFEKALKEYAPTLDARHPFAITLQEGFRRLVRKFPELEKRLQSWEMERPVALEKQFTLTLDGVTVRGVIDRLDQRADGALLILDYKTGTIDFTPDHLRQGVHFQALLYWLATEEMMRQPILGLLFYDLKKGELRRGILLTEKVSDETRKAVTRGHTLSTEAFALLKEEGLARLNEIAARMAQGDFTAQPSAAVCGPCDYASLCRRAHGYF